MAVKKRFEMHQVLSYRTELEKLKKQDFATAKITLDKACDLLEKEKEAAEKLARDFISRQQQIDSIDEMQLYSDFFARKRDEIKEHQKTIEILDRTLEEKRDELIQATKEKKVMERLKEKQEEAFRQEMAHKEGLLLDEIATQKKGQE